MKQTLLITTSLIITALMLVVGCSSDPIDEGTLDLKDGLMYAWNDDEPYTGKVVDTDVGETIRLSGLYENGVLVGEYTFYREDGSVVKPINIDELNKTVRGYFEAGVDWEDFFNYAYWGYAFSLYSNGQKESEGIIKGGVYEGLWTWWNENGQKEKEGNYNAMRKDGLWTWWYENGQKESEKTLKNDEQEGKWTEWYKNGEKRREGTYKDGKKDGLQTEWYENGRKKEEKTYKDGEVYHKGVEVPELKGTLPSTKPKKIKRRSKREIEAAKIKKYKKSKKQEKLKRSKK